MKGSAKFTVRVLKGRKITIGVCLHDVNMNSYVNKTSSGWGYYQSSGKYGHNGPAKKRGGESYKNEPGCIITTELKRGYGCGFDSTKTVSIRALHTMTYQSINDTILLFLYSSLRMELLFLNQSTVYENSNESQMLPYTTYISSSSL